MIILLKCVNDEVEIDIPDEELNQPAFELAMRWIIPAISVLIHQYDLFPRQ